MKKTCFLLTILITTTLLLINCNDEEELTINDMQNIFDDALKEVESEQAYDEIKEEHTKKNIQHWDPIEEKKQWKNRKFVITKENWITALAYYHEVIDKSYRIRKYYDKTLFSFVKIYLNNSDGEIPDYIKIYISDREIEIYELKRLLSSKEARSVGEENVVIKKWQQRLEYLEETNFILKND